MQCVPDTEQYSSENGAGQWAGQGRAGGMREKQNRKKKANVNLQLHVLN